jgi:hypothetical protein
MTPRAFLRALLALPLVVPVLAFASGSTSSVAFLLLMSVAFGAVPYLATAAFLWFRIGRCNTQKSAIALIFAAPLLFAPLQAIAWLLWSWLNPSEATGLAAALALAAYGLFFGYLYAAFATVAFLAAVRAGFVSSFLHVEEHA